MCERRRKCGRFFSRNSTLPDKLFVRRQSPADFLDDDIEEIIIDGTGHFPNLINFALSISGNRLIINHCWLSTLLILTHEN